MKTKLVLVSIIFVLVFSILGCQEAIENTIKTPVVDLHVNVDGLSSSGLDVSIEARIGNPNPVTLNIGDLEITAKGETGHTYIQDTALGGSIAPNSSRTFTHDITIPVDVLSERNMIVMANTRAGAAGITLPVTATTTIRTPDIEDLISAPGIALSINFGQLSSNGLDTSLQANISNPNPLSLDIGNMQIVVEGQSGNVIMTSTVAGGSISPNSSGTFRSDITILLQVLNERNIIVTLDSRAGVAGIISLPFGATANIQIPELTSVISVPHINVYLSKPKWKATFPLPSVELRIDSEIMNNNSVGLIVGDLHIKVFKSDGSLVKLITMFGGTIYPHSTRTFSNSITFGSEVLDLINSYATVIVESEVGIDGVNERIPISGEGRVWVGLPELP